MGNIGLEVSLILLLVVANGIFSMAEMAVVSSRKARLRQRAEQGSNCLLYSSDAPDEFTRFRRGASITA